MDDAVTHTVGKVVTLKNPIAIISEDIYAADDEDEDEEMVIEGEGEKKDSGFKKYKINGIVRKKIIFNNRPVPRLTAKKLPSEVSVEMSM